METDSYISNCKNNLSIIINNFKYDNLSDNDKIFIQLLAGITVVEKESADVDKIFNMLQNNYFQSALATAHFVNSLYNCDLGCLNEYLDIYLEQVYENELTQEDIKDKIDFIKGIYSIINPTLIEVIDTKVSRYANDIKL